jgi:hypothetical protein
MIKEKSYPEMFPILFYLLGSINGIVPLWASWFICLPLLLLILLWFFYELDLLKSEVKNDKRKLSK